MRSLELDLAPWRVIATKVAAPFCPCAYFRPFAPLRYRVHPEPPLPGGRWARVRTRLGGICGSDLHLVFLEGSLSVAPAVYPGRRPTFLGHETVGVVEEVGPDVSRVRRGDRVVMDGSNDCLSMEIDPPCPACASGNRIVCYNAAEKRGPQPSGGGWSESFVRHEASLWPVDASIPDEEAVLMEPASNGVRAALRASPRPGERALVIGAGTIGLMTIQALRAAEPEVDITVSVLFERQADEAMARGADRALVRGDLYEAARQVTGSRVYTGFRSSRAMTGGFDLACDCVGSPATLSTALRCVRTGGRVVLVGASLWPMKLDLTPVWYNEVDLLGMRSHGVETWRGETMPSYARVEKWVREGRLRLGGMLTHRYPLEEYRKALEMAAARDKQKDWAIKVAFDFT